ncbi:MAG: hypothetical protein QM484_07130 [Woeseiaceae bacterium]
MSYKISRQDLYDLVWLKPLRVLAKEFNVSDVALGKTCRRSGIPRPGAGYWAKLKSGKPTIKAKLQPRFPGFPEIIEIGRQHYRPYDDSKLINEPIPSPPTFDENISDVEERIKKIVNKVSYPTLSNKTHQLIIRFLKQDEDRKIEYQKYKIDLYAPKFTTAIEKRRLRILNAIFSACSALGCKAIMSISKYDYDNRDASIKVGEHQVSFNLKLLEVKGKNNKIEVINDRLQISVGPVNRKSEPIYWFDNNELLIENHLTEIVNKILLTGEMQYRDNMQWQYEWKLERREDLIEEERQRKIEEERKAHELKEKQDKERVGKLLGEAKALQHARTIREYVETVEQNIESIPENHEKVGEWAKWALKEADRIDPIVSLSFLEFKSPV